MKSNFKQTAVRTLLASAFGLVCATFGVNGYAATTTGNLAVSASVAANCTISAGSVAFGAYDPIVANATSAKSATGAVTTTCTNGSAAYITLSQGLDPATGSTDAAPVRQMISGSNSLKYFLYSDTSSTVWGNTGSSGKGDTGTGTTSALTVYGSVPAAQNVPVGTYADTVVATVTF